MLLKFALQDFLDDRQFKNVSTRTLKNNKEIIGKFIDFCVRAEITRVEDVEYQHIRQHLQECQQRGNNPTSINTKTQRIRSFFNYMIECDVIKSNPARKIRYLKEDIKINVFNNEQIQQMLSFYRRIKAREKSFVAYRDYMLIVFILGCGARRGEIISLKWSDIDFINYSVSLFGKRRIKETVPITEKLVKELSAYKTYCNQIWKEPSDFVFTKRDNTQISDWAINQIFEYLAEKMAFKDIRLTCHTFRHTFCHRLAMSGMSAFGIQKMMRHNDISVTMRYVAMWGNELREQNNKYNPLNFLEI